MPQYLLFLLNGGLLGLLSWALQLGIYRLMRSDTQVAYALASALACAPVVLLNLAIQRRLIFRQHGPLTRFVAANLLMLGLVSLLSPVFRTVVQVFAGADLAETLGFAIASLVASVPSFLLNKFWVFRPLPGRATG